MDQEADESLDVQEAPDAGGSPTGAGISRRRVLKYGACGLACLGAGGAAYYALKRGGSVARAVVGAVNEAVADATAATDVFKNDAPKGELWELWQKRGWAREARHYLKLGGNLQCKLCPNECLLGPEDRSHCRNRVHKDGTLYTMTYGYPCSRQIDPIEKKPLFHFLPGTRILSLATVGCNLHCLNCQNWEISQKKPEETKDPRGKPIRLNPQLQTLTSEDLARLSMFPEDVVAMAQYVGSLSVAYTYS